MKYEILLFDADNTILDFDKAEEEALKLSFAQCGIFYDDNVLSVYRRNNVRQWQLFESGAIADKSEVLSSRFVETFKELDIALDSAKTAELYEAYLHNGFYVIDGAESVLKQLQKQGFKLYLVSNGVLSIQNARMKGSGLDKYFLRRFVSEEVGRPKPSREYFDYCFSHIDGFDQSKTLIIGDSLTSDIQGGVNAGIDTCWYNSKRTVNSTLLKPTYEIYNLEELFEVIA